MKNYGIMFWTLVVGLFVMTMVFATNLDKLTEEFKQTKNDFLQLQENQEVLQYNFKQIAGAIERATIVCKTQ